MQATINRMMLGIMAGCLVMSSFVFAQQEPTQYVSSDMATAYGMAGQVQEQYVPNQPQTIYTNASQQVGDPVAQAEYMYSQQMVYNDGGFYPGGFYADQYAYGYQPYGYQPCVTSGYSPSLTCGQWYAGGWIDQGATWRTSKAGTKNNAPINFNDRFNEYQLNQLYLTMGRSVVNSGCCWDVGGRVDLLYGSDYLWTSAIGLETRIVDHYGSYQQNPYALPSKWNGNNGPRLGTFRQAERFGLAMPQLYAEMYVPVHYGLNIKAGHFYSIMGYESVMSPQNFFYTHTYSMMYGQPMTHTGILFSQKLTPRLTGIFGVTRGWDTWEDPNGKLSYLAGFRWNTWDGRTEFSMVAGTGNETVSDNLGGTSLPGAIRSNYSMVLSHQLTPRLKLVTQHDMGYEKSAAEVTRGRGYASEYVDGHWYSFSQYVFYQLTNKLTIGARGEWFRDVNSTRIYPHTPVRTYDGAGTLLEGVEGSDYSQVTIGLNWKPHDCLIIRPEARWDWSGVCYSDKNDPDRNVNGMYGNLEKKSQTTISLSAMVTF